MTATSRFLAERYLKSRGARIGAPRPPTRPVGRVETKLSESGDPLYSSSVLQLPAIVGKGLVGVCHFVRVFPLLHGAAAVVGGVQDLAGQLLRHGLLTTGSGVGDQPAHPE